MTLSFLPKRKRFLWRRPLVAIFVLLIIGIPAFFLTYERMYANTIFPGISVGVRPVGGKTLEQTSLFLEALTDQLVRSGFPFVAGGQRITITPILSAPSDPDLAYDLIHWDIETTVATAYAHGHTGSFLQRWLEQTQALLFGTTIPISYTIQRDELTSILEDNFRSLETPPVNAAFAVDTTGELTLTPEKMGETLDYDSVITQLNDHLENITSAPLTLTLQPEAPAIRADDAEQALRDARTLLTRGAIRFTYGERWWRFQPERIRDWLTLKHDDQGNVRLGINTQTMAEDLKTIATELDHEPRDAKFRMDKGRVVEFVTSRNGQRLAIAETITFMDDNIPRLMNAAGEKERDIPVIITALPPTVHNNEVNTFGIVDLLGVGRSNFKGSPPNRRHNIRVGAAALHGLLIAPKEEFSLLKALGTIDKENGYKPELVIKGNRTIPEYGGGLCQIGTTTFRATMASGLPVTERQNHSYSVSYYLENGKPGTDATIYGPKPDFKFVNDTGNAILIQTRIDGDELFFEFWGKKDGRIAERTEPKVWNLRNPGPTKIIETTDLPPGKKKCTERAHIGSTAEFTYTITYPNGEKKEKVFRSNYRPWQEVCLVGVAPEQKKSAEAPAGELPSPDAEGVKGE